MWKSYGVQIFVSIKKVLLEHSHIHSFTLCLWLFPVTKAKSANCNRLYGLQNPRYLLFGPLLKIFVYLWSKAMSQITVDSIVSSIAKKAQEQNKPPLE